MLDARQLEPALTKQDELLRDAFVSEYFKDYDPFKACVRLGFQATFAIEWAKRLFEDGYVQRKIAHMTEHRESDEAMKAKLETRLMQIALRGSDSAGVSAIKELNAMKGWSKPDGAADAEQGLIDAFKNLAQTLPS